MSSNNPNDETVWSVFLIFLRLGLTSFGGPVAHLGYFRNEFVIRRQWLNERSYADLIALCQFLPGPASSQVGMALGLTRKGLLGALAAWAGFTMPSAIMLALFSICLTHWGNAFPASLIHGLKVVAVAVVAQAVWGMGRNLCTDLTRVLVTLLSALIMLLYPTTFVQIMVIIIAALAGVIIFNPIQAQHHEPLPIKLSRKISIIFIGLFFGLLIGLPLLVKVIPNHTLIVFTAFYRAGALVFGGGHVVLPLLQAAVVPTGWVSNDNFLAGYGMAQAIPGPLFTFSAFLGASMTSQPNGWIGASICLFAIFLPSFLLVFAALPFWDQLRRSVHTQAALTGVNAAVVGLLLTALYNPVWTNAIFKPIDFALAVFALLALMYWKLPPWLVVFGGGVCAWFINNYEQIIDNLFGLIF
jgi:chromate transporter